MSPILGIVASSMQGAIASSAYVVVTHDTTPFVTAYPWSDATGFGTKYANPATLPTSGSYGAAFNNDNTNVAIAIDASPRLHVYPWSASGFGTKYSNPATLPAGSGMQPVWGASNQTLFIATQSSPYIQAYPWSSGFGTKYADPATLPTAAGYGIDRNLVTQDIAIGAGTFMQVYPWSSGFGTKYADPATLPLSAAGGSVSFNAQGTALAFNSAQSLTPYMQVYPWSAGFGSKYANPATLPAAGAGGVVFNPAGTAIVICNTTTSPYLEGYPWSAGFGTKYSNPATLPAGGAGYNGQEVAFSKSGAALGISIGTSPYIVTYAFNAVTGFGTKYANPATLPAGSAHGIAFSN